MASLNKAILIGNLTRDPEVRTTGSGVAVCTFTIAVNRRFANQQGVREADFINIVAWRQTAEFITKYFKKGNMIGIEGSIQTRRYTDKNGNNRTAFEVVANNAQFVESKRDGGSPMGDTVAPASFSNADVNDFADLGDATDDDLPF